MTEYFVVRWQVASDPTWYTQGFDTRESATVYADSIRADESRWEKSAPDVRVEVIRFTFAETISTFAC